MMDNMIQNDDYDIKNIFELYKDTYINNKIR